MLIKITLLICILIINIQFIESQEWVFDNLTKNSNNYLVSDICIDSNSIWMISFVNELVRYNNDNNNEIYYLDFTRSGDIKNFKQQSKNNSRIYTNLLSKNNVLWIFQRNGFEFIKLVNETFLNYSLKLENGTYVNNYAIDDFGKLWFTLDRLDSDKYISDIYCSEDSTFKKIIFQNGEFPTQVTSISFRENSLILTGFNYNPNKVNYSFCVYYYANDSLTNKIILENDLNSNVYSLSHKSYIDTKGILYLLTNEGIFYKVQDQSFNKIDLNFKISSDCFWFVIDNSTLYYSYNNKILKCELLSKDLSYIDKPFPNTQSRWKNIKFFNNKIYGIFSSTHPYDCYLDFSSEIGILDVK